MCVCVWMWELNWIDIHTIILVEWTRFIVHTHRHKHVFKWENYWVIRSNNNIVCVIVVGTIRTDWPKKNEKWNGISHTHSVCEKNHIFFNVFNVEREKHQEIFSRFLDHCHSDTHVTNKTNSEKKIFVCMWFIHSRIFW